ncbi:MAG: hypothetical protein HC918_11690, partial [Oscillatoriales cyanobacterium SM2_1_8]|nr:hypothetical protein [Oscillatoriales cyanobacterium SM2_1_8]
MFIKYGFSWLPQWQKFLREPISDALIYVLNKLLKEEVADRYGRAEEMLQDIERLRKPPPQLPEPAGVSDEEFIESFLQEVRVEAPAVAIAAGTAAGNLAVEEDDNLDAILADFRSTVEPPPSTQVDDEKLLSSLLEDLGTQMREEFTSNGSTVVEEVDLLTLPPLREVTETWQTVAAFETHSTGISYLAALSGSERVLTAGVRRTVKIWSTADGGLGQSLVLPNTCGTCGGTGQVQRTVRVVLMDTVQKSTCPGTVPVLARACPMGLRFRSASLFA